MGANRNANGNLTVNRNINNTNINNSSNADRIIDWKKNMDIFFPDVKRFFSVVKIKDNYKERAETVVKFLGNEGYFCVARKASLEVSYRLCVEHVTNDANNNENWKQAEFENNGAYFTIGKLAKIPLKEDFKHHVYSAICAAQSNSNTLEEKRETLEREFETHAIQANIYLIKGDESESGFYGSFANECYMCEIKGDTKYIVWLFA